MINYDEALSFIHGINSLFCNPGLERTRELCRALGDPQDKLKFIHIAGTNGKGSTSAMLDSILREAGYKVGLYTSPFVLKFNERIRVNGESISDNELCQMVELIRPMAEKMEDKPTEFELITAIAFEHFRRSGCDVVVLECGLGGRFDATNVISTSLLSIITGISLDHTGILGDRVEKIAYEKAGIIKKNVPLILGGESAEADAVISCEAEKKDAPILKIDYSRIKIKNADLEGTEFDFGEWKGVNLSLLGMYQPRNAAVVLTAVEKLREGGFVIPDEAVFAGLKKAKWMARFEIISKNPTVIFDGAHNAEGISAARRSIEEYFGDKDVIVISGVLRDKEYEKIAADIAAVSREVYTITPPSPRAMSAADYAEVLRKNGAFATPCDSMSEAISLAKKSAQDRGKTVFILGSLYTYAEAISAIKS